MRYFLALAALLATIIFPATLPAQPLPSRDQACAQGEGYWPGNSPARHYIPDDYNISIRLASGTQVATDERSDPRVTPRGPLACEMVVMVSENDIDPATGTVSQGFFSGCGNWGTFPPQIVRRPAPPPPREEVCDGVDNDDDGFVDEGFDADGDGVTSCGGDCDDDDGDRFPGNPEVCDDIDNDCDGEVDEGACDPSSRPHLWWAAGISGAPGSVIYSFGTHTGPTLVTPAFSFGFFGGVRVTRTPDRWCISPELTVTFGWKIK